MVLVTVVMATVIVEHLACWAVWSGCRFLRVSMRMAKI